VNPNKGFIKQLYSYEQLNNESKIDKEKEKENVKENEKEIENVKEK